MLRDLLKHVDSDASSKEEVSEAIAAIISKKQEALQTAYPYGYAVAYADGERYIWKNSKLGPVDIDWHGFFLRRDGDTFTIKLPKIATPFAVIENGTASGDIDWLKEFTVIDSADYRLGVDVVETGDRNVAVIVGVHPRDR